MTSFESPSSITSLLITVPFSSTGLTWYFYILTFCPCHFILGSLWTTLSSTWPPAVQVTDVLQLQAGKISKGHADVSDSIKETFWELYWLTLQQWQHVGLFSVYGQYLICVNTFLHHFLSQRLSLRPPLSLFGVFIVLQSFDISSTSHWRTGPLGIFLDL